MIECHGEGRQSNRKNCDESLRIIRYQYHNNYYDPSIIIIFTLCHNLNFTKSSNASLSFKHESNSDFYQCHTFVLFNLENILNMLPKIRPELITWVFNFVFTLVCLAWIKYQPKRPCSYRPEQHWYGQDNPYNWCEKLLSKEKKDINE